MVSKEWIDREITKAKIRVYNQIEIKVMLAKSSIDANEVVRIYTDLGILPVTLPIKISTERITDEQIKEINEEWESHIGSQGSPVIQPYRGIINPLDHEQSK